MAAEENNNRITDEYMRRVLKLRRNYTIVFIRGGPKENDPGADELIWEHGRRNLELRRDGILNVICRIRDDSDVEGLEIFNADTDATRRIMEEDVAVKAGVLAYEIHPAVSFPGDALAQ